MASPTTQVPTANATVLVGVQGMFQTVWYAFFQSLCNSAVPQIGDCVVQATPGVERGGWLFCDGSAVSRQLYNALFQSIGVTYGVGDGSSTFNLPNFVSPGAPAAWKIRFR